MKAGDQVYKFQLLAPLNSGEFGTVWKAKDVSIDRIVALKFLEASFQPVISLLEEARIGNRLNHPCVVQVLYADVADYGGKKFALLAQEFISNGSILGRLNSRNFLPVSVVMQYLIDVLSGLEYLHNHGIYHNDIKPSNILIGDSGQAMLTDYGISGVDSSGSRRSIVPKSAYKVHRAPETASLSPVINVQTDIYQVGVTAFRLMNGISFVSEDFDSLDEDEFERQKACGKIPDKKLYLPFIPREIKAIINKALSINASDRFKSALEMRRRLESLAFPVSWTTDSSGHYVGVGTKCTYRFEEICIGWNQFNFTSFRKLNHSGNEFKIREFCCSKATKKEIDIIKKKFFRETTKNGN